MESLSEELLDHVISRLRHTVGGYPEPDFQALSNMSLVSHKLHRITEPHLYRTLKLQPKNRSRLLRTARTRPSLLNHTQELQLTGEPIQAPSIVDSLPGLSNLQILDINVGSFGARNWVPLLRLPSITTLYLRNFTPTRLDEEDENDWDFVNYSAKVLHVYFAEPNDDPWEDCDDVPRLADLFPALEYLKLSGCEHERHICELDGFVFRYLVYAFRGAFQMSLKSFEFWYNGEGILSAYVDMDKIISMVFDAANTLKQSKIETLRLDTHCLLPYSTSDRSGTLTLSNLPMTLRKVYLRHVVYIEDTAIGEEALESIHSQEEMRCLVQLFEELVWFQRSPQLREVTLALFLPEVYTDVAIGAIKKYGACKDTKMRLILA